MKTTNLTIVGGGTIGYRLLQTCLLQPDFNILGITKRDFSNADGKFLEKNYSHLIFDKSKLEDKLKESDVVIDCTDKSAHKLLPIYKKFYNLKIIMQGGEKDNLANTFFNSYLDYNLAQNSHIVQINSCNDTNLIRIIYSFNDLYNNGDLISIDWSLCRRAADPKQSKKGPINAIQASTNTHHAPHVQKSFPNLEIISNAYKGSFTEMHTQIPVFFSKKKITVDDVIKRLEKINRIALLESKSFPSTAEVREYGRKLSIFNGRFGDIYETIVWKDQISVIEETPFKEIPEKKLYKISIPTAIHQEAIVIPDNIDAIRALNNSMNKQSSIILTDHLLNIGKGWPK